MVSCISQVFQALIVGLNHLVFVSFSWLPSSRNESKQLYKESEKTLQTASLNLLIINTASPLYFAYGRQRMDENLAERAFELLEKLPAERNYITRCWERAGLHVQHAADSQALIQLRRNYCDRKDCLRCRFGAEYLRGEG